MKRTHVYSAVAAAAFVALVVVADTRFDAFTLRVFNLCAIYVVLALSLNLVNGFTGLFSLGHAGFMAVGAYTSALLTMIARAEGDELLPRAHHPLAGQRSSFPSCRR